MGEIITGQNAECVYNFRNFDIFCEQCEVGERQRTEALEYFLYGNAPADDALLRHFAAMKVFYANLFLTQGIYNETTDVIRIVLNNAYNRGLRAIISPGCHIRSRAEAFMRRYKNDRAVLIDTKTTDRLDMANMVRVDDYGLKFICPGRGVYLIQQARATEYIYGEKKGGGDTPPCRHSGLDPGSHTAADVMGSRVKPGMTEEGFAAASDCEEPEARARPSLIRAVTIGFTRKPEAAGERTAAIGRPDAIEKPAEKSVDGGHARPIPVESLKKLVDTLARQGFASSARMVKILLNNYSAIVNDLPRAKDKHAWLDGHYYVYALLDNSAASAYKQLEKAAGECDDAIRRYEALKSLAVNKPAFISVWNACLRALEQHGIR